MRWLPLLALAACSQVTSRATDDALIDTPDFPRPDAPGYDAPLPDAYAPGACDAPATFADGRTPSRVLHVRPGAVGGDGSVAAPFGSIVAAAAVATPGTFIQLETGYHAANQFVPNLRGTADAPIWIGGAFGARPVVLGGSEGLHLTNAAYVVVQNLAVRSQSATGINVDDGVGTGLAHHVLLSNVACDELDVAGQACLRATGVDDLYIYDSLVQHSNYGIDLVGVHRGVVARNRVGNSALTAIQTRGGSTDVDVRQNRIWEGGNTGISLGGSTPFAWFRPPLSTTSPNAEARRIRAFDNMVLGSTYAPFVFTSCVDCLLAHNLSLGTPGRVLRLWGTLSQNGYTFEPTRNGRVINNSFVWQADLVNHVEIGSAAAVDTFTFSHNLWYEATPASQSTPYFFPSMAVVPDTGGVIGQGSGYFGATITNISQLCAGPEADAAAPLPEVDGTIDGTCRAPGGYQTIGPQIYDPAGCTL